MRPGSGPVQLLLQRALVLLQECKHQPLTSQLGTIEFAFVRLVEDCRGFIEAVGQNTAQYPVPVAQRTRKQTSCFA